MAKARINIIKALLLICITGIFCSCNKPRDLVYGPISNVSVKNLSLSGVDAEGTMQIENPNGFNITVQNVQLDLMADDKVIAHITELYPVTIAAKTKADYKVGASIKLANVGAIMSLMSLMNNSNTNLILDGTLKAKSFVITKTVKIHQTNIQNYLKPLVDKLRLF